MRVRLLLTGADADLGGRIGARVAARWPGVLSRAEPGVRCLSVSVAGLDEPAAWFAVAVRLAQLLAPAPAQALPRTGAREFSRRGLLGFVGIASGDEAEPVPNVRLSSCQLDSGCRRCVAACPVQALSLVGGKLGLDSALCSRCGQCVAACPVGALEQPPASSAGLDAVLALVRETGRADVVVVFTCSADAVPVAPWVAPVVVGDVGSVGVRALVAAVAAGACGVLVRCADKGCAGREAARAAVGRATEALTPDGPTVVCVDGALSSADVEAVRHAARGRPIDVASTSGGDPWAAYAAGVVALGRPDASTAGLGFADARVADGCTMCGACANVCPRGAWRLDDGALSFRASACSGCGACVACCPERVLTLAPAVSTVAEVDAWRVAHADEMVLCRMCGKPVGSRAMWARVCEVLGPRVRVPDLCPTCKQDAAPR